MHTSFLSVRRAWAHAAAGAVAVLALAAQAQSPAPAVPASAPGAPSRPATTLAPVVVTGNPIGSAEVAAPVSVLGGDELVLRRGSSLGETLRGQPGVSSSYFGPNANRPVIRGLDGDRVRVLSNSGASFDASTLSFDHAVPIDPLVVERIEVLRGAGALLYGGSAIGGVVNSIDNRIPKYPLSGVSGQGEVRLGGAERERAGAVLVEAGNGRFAIHADAFGRRTSDLAVPRYTPVNAEGEVLEPTTRVRNSAARTHGGAAGASYTFGSGYVGLSGDVYESRYGIVAEEDVLIRMERRHVGLGGEARDLQGAVQTLRVQLNDTRYRHEEVEGTGAIGTTFRSSGTDLRLEAAHAPLGPLKGVVGVQLENVDFSALGEEAFVPATQTRRRALFVVEELATPLGTVSAGLRYERVRVASEGDRDPAEPQFGAPVRRSFGLKSASLGWVRKLGGEWTLSGTFSTSARAPTSFELFANGVHAATAAFERGDPSLEVERGNNLDVALEWKAGADRVRLGAYVARFSRFISLEATGATVAEMNEDGSVSQLPEYAYRPVRAGLHGLELEAAHRLQKGAWTFDATGKLDVARGHNRDTGEPLPRISPLRVTIGVDAGTGGWLGRIELEHVGRQTRVPAYDTETGSYRIVNLALTRRFDFFGADAYWFVKATNLGDTLAYSASTIETVRGLVPLPGRAVKAGLRAAF